MIHSEHRYLSSRRRVEIITATAGEPWNKLQPRPGSLNATKPKYRLWEAHGAFGGLRNGWAVEDLHLRTSANNFLALRSGPNVLSSDVTSVAQPRLLRSSSPHAHAGTHVDPSLLGAAISAHGKTNRRYPAIDPSEKRLRSCYTAGQEGSLARHCSIYSDFYSCLTGHPASTSITYHTLTARGKLTGITYGECTKMMYLLKGAPRSFDALGLLGEHSI